MKTLKSNKSKRPMNGSSKLKGILEIVLVTALILIIPLFFAVRSQAVQTADTSTPLPLVTTIPEGTSVPSTPHEPIAAEEGTD